MAPRSSVSGTGSGPGARDKETGWGVFRLPRFKGSWAWPQGWALGAAPLLSDSRALQGCLEGAKLAPRELTRPGSEFFLYWCQGQPPPPPLLVQAPLVCGEEVPPPSVLTAHPGLIRVSAGMAGSDTVTPGLSPGGSLRAQAQSRTALGGTLQRQPGSRLGLEAGGPTHPVNGRFHSPDPGPLPVLSQPRPRVPQRTE